MKLLKYLLTLILLLLSFHYIKAEYFSSISGLEDLLTLESLYLDSLEEHIEEVEKFNKEIERVLDEIEEEQLKIQNDLSEYFKHPMNVFKAIKRIAVDWNEMEDLTHQIQAINVYNKSSSESLEDFTPPTQNDLEGAARGISRLQDIYKFSSEEMAKGQLGNHQYYSKLTSSDCFELGKSLYNSRENLYASEWLIEAMYRSQDEANNGIKDIEYTLDLEVDNKEDEDIRTKNDGEDISLEIEQFHTNSEKVAWYPYVTNITILEYLGASLANGGNPKLARIINQQLLALEPKNSFGLKNKDQYEEGARKAQRLRLLKQPVIEMKLARLSAKVCNGELQQPPREKRFLRCRYVTNNVSYYFLGPLKMEELNLEPFVALYHQIISDNETDQITTTVSQSLERSQVGHGEELRIGEVRVSKGTWLYYEKHPFMMKLSQRIEDITGLSMKRAEPLQVANYGIGGHYGPHMDSTDDPDLAHPGRGNRMLTALFFINNVELGGATAFPILRLAVPPVKNNLLVWYNLHRSGDMDYRSYHLGCPVIKGSKWIANQWIHTVGQEFTRPCDILSDTNASKQYENINSDV